MFCVFASCEVMCSHVSVSVADLAGGYLFTGVTMTDRISAAINDETSKLCLSSNECNNLIDGIPSLDALSFERELCPSQNCLCHSRKHLQNNRDSSGLSAFGVQTSATLIRAHKPASCSDHATGLKESRCGLQLAQPTFQPLMLGCPVVCQSNTDAVSAGNNCDRVFGSGYGHPNASGNQSFAQLCCTTDTNTSENAAAAGHPPTFENSHRSGQLLTDPTHSPHEINLSDLQSVLLTTAEESLPVTNCPVHQHSSSVERFPACTCGQQASRLDDCTFDELAAYLDNFCYIPKNMSPMAEMMYM